MSECDDLEATTYCCCCCCCCCLLLLLWLLCAVVRVDCNGRLTFDGLSRPESESGGGRCGVRAVLDGMEVVLANRWVLDPEMSG